MNRLLFAAVVVIVGAGLIAGFLIVGGPGYARKERHDMERAADLRTLADYHRCVLARKQGEADGIPPPPCSGFEQAPDLSDPATGEPYRHEELSPGSFRVCARFQTESQQEERNQRYSELSFEGSEGCVVYGQDPGGDASGATLNWTKD